MQLGHHWFSGRRDPVGFRECIIDAHLTPGAPSNLEQENSRSNQNNSHPLPDRERLMKDLPTDQLEKRESTTVTKRVSKARTGLLQGKGQSQRPECADNVSHDKVPYSAPAAGVSGVFEKNG